MALMMGLVGKYSSERRGTKGVDGAPTDHDSRPEQPNAEGEWRGGVEVG